TLEARFLRRRLATISSPCIQFCGICKLMYFEIIGEIESIASIAIGTSIRDIARLRKPYGTGRWRKLKGTATVRLRSGAVHRAEIHWYEDHGVGNVKFKIEEFLDEPA